MREAWNPMGPKNEAHFQAKNMDRKIEGRNCDLQSFGPDFLPENGPYFSDPAGPALVPWVQGRDPCVRCGSRR